MSYDVLGGRELLKPSECRHYGGRGLAKSWYKVYSGWKILIYGSSCSIYDICGGRGWLKTSEYRRMGEGLILPKTPSYDIRTFPCLPIYHCTLYCDRVRFRP